MNEYNVIVIYSGRGSDFFVKDESIKVKAEFCKINDNGDLIFENQNKHGIKKIVTSFAVGYWKSLNKKDS